MDENMSKKVEKPASEPQQEAAKLVYSEAERKILDDILQCMERIRLKFKQENRVFDGRKFTICAGRR